MEECALVRFDKVSLIFSPDFHFEQGFLVLVMISYIFHEVIYR